MKVRAFAQTDQKQIGHRSKYFTAFASSHKTYLVMCKQERNKIILDFVEQQSNGMHKTFVLLVQKNVSLVALILTASSCTAL